MMKTPSMLVRQASNRPAGVGVAATLRPTVVTRVVPAALLAPVAAGAMPRKKFVPPKLAVPMRSRAPGLAKVSRYDRFSRGRILQRGTR